MTSFLSHYQGLFHKVLSTQQGESTPHAFLFYGDPERGTKLFAMHLCRELLGLSEDSLEFQWISNHSHPQVLVLDSPEANFPIEKVRETLQNFYQRSNGEALFLIIHGLDKLKTEAVNAILKTIEEPPASSLIFCTSRQKDSILATLLSRFIPFEFPAIKKADTPEEKHRAWEFCQGAWLCMQNTDPNLLQDISQLKLDKLTDIHTFIQTKLQDLEGSEKLVDDLTLFAKTLFFHRKKQPAILQKMTEAIELAILEKNANVNPKIILRSLQLRLLSILNSSL